MSQLVVALPSAFAELSHNNPLVLISVLRIQSETDSTILENQAKYLDSSFHCIHSTLKLSLCLIVAELFTRNRETKTIKQFYTDTFSRLTEGRISGSDARDLIIPSQFMYKLFYFLETSSDLSLKVESFKTRLIESFSWKMLEKIIRIICKRFPGDTNTQFQYDLLSSIVECKCKVLKRYQVRKGDLDKIWLASLKKLQLLPHANCEAIDNALGACIRQNGLDSICNQQSLYESDNKETICPEQHSDLKSDSDERVEHLPLQLPELLNNPPTTTSSNNSSSNSPAKEHLVPYKGTRTSNQIQVSNSSDTSITHQVKRKCQQVLDEPEYTVKRIVKWSFESDLNQVLYFCKFEDYPSVETDKDCWLLASDFNGDRQLLVKFLEKEVQKQKKEITKLKGDKPTTTATPNTTATCNTNTISLGESSNEMISHPPDSRI